YEYTLEVLAQRNDIEDLQFTNEVYHSPLSPEVFDIKTKYEMMFAEKGETIKYLRFRFKFKS
ncbi:MAG: tRNA (guanosine(46)-N7)-methyltransferase TrmB, partial [Cytophagia bacterium]|nr:tRNA (guanosine(46)-N7)-methyltransferase TrmB [Cytophagia bacterium]